jgi:(2R)-3-sulfolactate dehydrogenase (NADP+)
MLADDEVRLPGERRRTNRERAARDGVAVPPELLAKIRALAGKSHA